MENYIADYIEKSAVDALFSALNDFDAEKIHSIMNSLGWTWHDTFNGPNNIPTPEDIRHNAYNLLFDAYDKYWQGNDSEITIATGGLEATYYFDEKETNDKYKHVFILKFVLEESSNI